MKKILLVALLGVGCMLSGIAQEKKFEDICRKYKGEEHVVCLQAGRLGCIFVSLFAGAADETAGRFIRNSRSFRLLVVEGNEQTELNREVESYIRNGKLEELMSVKKKKQTVKIYVQDTKSTIRQLFLAVANDNEYVYLQVEGRYPIRLIQELALKKH